MTVVFYTFNFLNLPSKVLKQRKQGKIDMSLIVERILLLF